MNDCWLLSTLSCGDALSPKRLLRSLEEQAEAAASQSAHNAGRDDVLQSAERSASEAAEKDSADGGEDVGVRCDFEFLVSHLPNSSFVPRKRLRFSCSLAASFPEGRVISTQAKVSTSFWTVQRDFTPPKTRCDSMSHHISN
jgi:hypothetical protein